MQILEIVEYCLSLECLAYPIRPVAQIPHFFPA